MRTVWSLLAFATVEATHELPFDFSPVLPEPLAYYWFAEGEGSDLLDDVSSTNSGRIALEAESNTGPNWRKDGNFGNVIACGSNETLQKDIVFLSDVDYGANGSF